MSEAKLREELEEFVHNEFEEDIETDIEDSDTALDKIKSMIRNNKLAVFSAFIILAICIVAILAPIFSPYDPNAQVLKDRLIAPCSTHLLGTDELGRDVLSRLIYGARISLVIGIVPTVISMVIGTIMYTLGASLINIFIALSLVNWAGTARIVRSQTLALKEKEFVEAAISIGVKKSVIMFKHILPNCISSLIVLFTLNVPASILSESSLSFLGIGAQPPSTSWGLMVVRGKQYLFTDPWISIAPGIAILVIVLAFNFLGDGLRDAIDPYLKE